MRWKQFFTPVQSFDALEADDYMRQTNAAAYTLLDVRQPKEYEAEHLPGAKLVPLPDLGERIAELDAAKPTLVYCAIGGRSRIAAQMLASKGFKEVYNLSGGIKAWASKKAVGKEDVGLSLFSGKESPVETLVVAYSLEAGLRDFYLSMAAEVDDVKTTALFRKLSDIEVKHQDRIFEEFMRVTRGSMDRAAFEKQMVAPQMEGGLSTDEYLAIYQPDMTVPLEVISLAMAIEAQALDLYQRAGDRAETEENKIALLKIADEERAHLAQLGRLVESL
ncbi:MAG: sulfurtransferase [Desulfobacteraceae bacterium]|nr:sulfurtransferase [Desulfobacteraceae bacterium]MBC2753667.1 sulfurtransferase [Desulfobacteraceae bacterium]